MSRAEMIAAHQATWRAIRSGALVRATRCARCSAEGQRLDAHHKDYRSPLDVEWLCRSCHRQHHGDDQRRPHPLTHRSSREAIETLRRLREALEKKSTTEIAEACRVDPRTVRNWRDGKLPRSSAIKANLETYLERVTS